MRDFIRIFLYISLTISFLWCCSNYFTSLVYAHPIVIDSNPKQFQSLETAPDKVIVYFSEPIVLQYSQISVIDSEGNRVDEGNAANFNDDSATISVPLKSDVTPGTFTINTKVLSAVDGHVVDESRVFSIGEGEGDFTQIESSSKDIFDLLSIENSLSRIWGYVGQIVIVGAAFMFLWIQKPLSKFEWIKSYLQPSLYLVKKNVIKLIIIGDGLILLSVGATVLLQSYAIGGSVEDVFNTEFGKIILIRLVLSLILLGFLLLSYKKLVSKNKINPSKYFITIMGLGLIVLLTNSLISHSAALNNIGPIFIDYFHSIAASFWIGGLIFLTFVFLSKIFLINDENLKAKIISTIIPRFSIIVIPVLGSISITGPILLWSLENNLSITIASLYGKILIIKLVIAGIMIILGGYHQFITEKRISTLSISNIGETGRSKGLITPDTNILKKLKWSLRIETILGISLLFVVSILANMALPSGEVSSTDTNTNFIETINLQSETKNNDTYSTIVYTEDQKIQVNLQPARLGQNNIFVDFIDYNNKPIDTISNATLKLSQLERNIGPIQIDMEKISNGSFNALIPFSTLGLWNLEIQGKTLQPNTPNIVANLEVNIKPRNSDLQFNITEYKTPDSSLLLYPIYQASTNSIWVGDSQPGSGRIWEFEIESKSYKEHKINDVNLITLSLFDPLNEYILWFLDPTSSILGKYNTDTNTTEIFELPNKGVISGLTIDDNQNIWMTVIQDNSILKYDINKNEFETFRIPTENSRPLGIIYDGNNEYIWFAESIGKIGQLDINSNTFREYPNASKSNTVENDILGEPTFLLLDPQTSNIYISDHEKNSIFLFNTLTSEFKEYKLTDPNGLAFGMALDTYNNLWIAQHVSDTLAILDPETGDTTNIDIPTSNSFVQYLITDSKKDVWFAEQRGNALGKVTTQFIPSVASQPTPNTNQKTSTIDNNTDNDQTLINIPNIMSFENIRFNSLFGPFIIIALVASTIMYLNSSNQLRKKLLEIESIENAKKEKNTKKKTR